MLSFWASITYQAIHGILNNGTTGRKDMQAQKAEELLLRVLPVLNSAMRASNGPETVIACYMIVIALVSETPLGDKVLDEMMKAVVMAYDNDTLNQCLMTLAAIAEQRSHARIPDSVSKKLLKIPQVSRMLATISKECHVERLALGCALGALSGPSITDEKRDTLKELVGSSFLAESDLTIIFSALVRTIRDSAQGSEEHGQLLELTGNLAEAPLLAKTLQTVAQQNDIDLASLGVTISQSLEATQVNGFESEDEEMLDADDETNSSAVSIQVPTFKATSFLDSAESSQFADVVTAFEQVAAANSKNQINRFLASASLGQKGAFQQTVYLTFLARTWSTSRSVSARVNALHATTTTIKQLDAASVVQHVIPYLVYALTDISPVVRRSAARCILALSEKNATKTTSKTWGSDMYGKSNKVLELKPDEVSTLLSSILAPILEECVMDHKFVIPALKDVLEGTQSPNQPKSGIKAQLRTSILAFLGSHIANTPLLKVRICLIPSLNFLGKASTAVRSDALLPLIKQWCSLSAADVATQCAEEQLSTDEAERGHLNGLMGKELKSAQLLEEVISGNLNNERTVLANAAFDQINAFWPSIKSESRLSLAHCMLELSLKESAAAIDQLRKERALETLREVKLDSATLVSFLESVPSAVQMPEGPPTKKRRRTSRNELARVDVSSTDDLQRLLRRLTLVLELIEGSNPGQHPALFRNLFSVFGELQPLKQQSGSELVYLQSMILGALTPIVNTLKVTTSSLYQPSKLTPSRSTPRLPNTSQLYERTSLLTLSDTPLARRYRTVRCC
jgi:U3 small nucleolar RNA-associated protein 10